MNLIEHKPSDDYNMYQTRLLKELVTPLYDQILELAVIRSKEGKKDNIWENFCAFIKEIQKQESNLKKAATMKAVRLCESEIV